MSGLQDAAAFLHIYATTGHDISKAFNLEKIYCHFNLITILLSFSL